MESRTVKILVIDDIEDNLTSLKALIKESFSDATILTALSGLQGLELAALEDPDVILLDILMPDIDGYEVCRRLKGDKKLCNIPVVFITALKADKESRIRALDCGAEAFLSKPIDESELTAQIRAMVKIKAANIEKINEKEQLAALVAERTQELQENHTATMNILEDLKNENESRKKSEEALRESAVEIGKSFDKLNKTLNSFITAMSYTVEARDSYTAGHQRRVAGLAAEIASSMGLAADVVESVKMAASIHDLGKISIPSEILTKPGKLNTIEFDFVKLHCKIGYDILKNIDFPWPLADIIHQHHEKIDGSGYPGGLSDEEILLEAKILAVADAVEAMISHRPYRPALGIEYALSELLKFRGVYYDTAVVDVCITIFNENGYVMLSN